MNDRNSARDPEISGAQSTLLHKQILARDARVGIIGMGYVGLPLALTTAEAGFSVTGFDLDADKVSDLNAGRSYIAHIAPENVASAIASERFHATAEFFELRKMDVILVCVPTPLTRQREPDMSYVEQTAKQIANELRAGQLIILESTTYPGTTSDLIRPVLEQTGLASSREFFLAYSPEREDPGNPDFSTKRIPKVVGGDGEAALALGVAFYEQIVPSVVPVSSTGTAEAVKLTENIFRAVNIALVNELKVIYEAMGIDVWEVIEAAKTKPFGYMPFYPGPGLGGHCIPIDPFYLTWKAREYDISTRFIELAGEINAAMPHYVVEKLVAGLNDRAGKGLKGARVLVVGVAYKKNVDDIRGSASFKIIRLLQERGADVLYYDPYVPVLPETRDHPSLGGMTSEAWGEALFEDLDAALILTDHDGVDYQELVERCPLLVDTRNVTARLDPPPETVIKA
jgi:UDP-N-acetyl-D-glucosamine dehydrogenase